MRRAKRMVTGIKDPADRLGDARLEVGPLCPFGTPDMDRGAADLHLLHPVDGEKGGGQGGALGLGSREART